MTAKITSVLIVGMLRLRWEQPPADSLNGALIAYKLRYKQRGKGSRSTVVTIDATALEHKIDSLDAGITYQARVAAQNEVSISCLINKRLGQCLQNGTGPYSEWASAEVLEEVDDEIAPAPSELRLVPEHDRIHVTWHAPHEHGIVIRGYAVGDYVPYWI